MSTGKAVGICSYQIEHGYAAMRTRSVSTSQWRHDCEIIAARLDMPIDQHPGLYAYRYVVYQKKLGSSNPFYLLGRELTLWVVQNANPQGGPLPAGAVIMRLVGPANDIRPLVGRLSERSFEREAQAETVSQRISMRDPDLYLAKLREIGDSMFRTWWASTTVAAHRMIVALHKAQGPT